MKITDAKPQNIQDINSEIESLIEEDTEEVDDNDVEVEEDIEEEEDQEDATIIDASPIPDIEFAGIVDGDRPKRNNSKPKVDTPTSDDLVSTLEHIDDVFDRALTPYVLLGDTGKGLFEAGDPFAFSDDLHIGIRKSHFYDYNERTLREYLVGAEYEEDSIYYVHNGVTVYIDLLQDSKFIEYPETHVFMYMNLALPNPFMEYYKEEFSK